MIGVWYCCCYWLSDFYELEFPYSSEVLYFWWSTTMGYFYVLFPVKANVVGQEDSAPIGLGLSLIFTMALAGCSFRYELDELQKLILPSLCWWNFCLYLSLRRDLNSVSSHAWIHLWNYLAVTVQGCKPMFCILFSFSMYFLSWQYQWLEFLQKEDKCSSKDTSMPYSLNLQKYRNDRIYT